MSIRRPRRPAPLALALAVALLAIAPACASARPLDLGALQGTRRFVSVSYPSPQAVRARAGDRDTTLHGVTELRGWVAGVRGDTVDVQVADWRADRRRHAPPSADHVAAVPSSAHAIVRPTGEPSILPVITVVGVTAVLLVMYAVWQLRDFS